MTNQVETEEENKIATAVALMEYRNPLSVRVGVIECETKEPNGDWKPSGLSVSSKSALNRALYDRIAADYPDGVPSPPRPPLQEQKAFALAEVRLIATNIRTEIAKDVDAARAIAWSFKVIFGMAHAVNEAFESMGADGPPDKSALSALAAAGEIGFESEASFTGEVGSDLMANSAARGIGFFLATQIVEGMERAAETAIPAAETQEAFDAVVVQLREAETAAKAQLEAIQSAG
jgi:hypothetical protein